MKGEDSGSFIFQRINHQVFQDPILLMGNIERVCHHLQGKMDEPMGPGSFQRALTIVPANDGKPVHRESEKTGGPSFWRCFEFIDGCTSHDVIDSPELAYQAALQFGKFQNLMSDLEGERLVETIPDFHHTPKRYAALKSAILSDPLERAKGCHDEIRFALQNEAIAHRLINLNRRGLIPERIIHNDTKISNVLFCSETGEGVCVVDLDTVMPGLSLYDFGDLVRTTISPVPEDSTDLDSIEIRLPVFEALAAGFLEAMGDILTPIEHENLAFSGLLLTYEVGIRFLTDHLLGDHYFGANHQNHNLHRARNQFRLLANLQASHAQLSKHQLTV